MVGLTIVIIMGAINGENNIVFFPAIKANEIGLFSICVYISYSCLCLTPVFIEVIENIKWKHIERTMDIIHNKQLQDKNMCPELWEV